MASDSGEPASASGDTMKVMKDQFLAGLRDVVAMVKRNPVQFFLAVGLVMLCGATKKLQTFPMPYVAGKSECSTLVDAGPGRKFGIPRLDTCLGNMQSSFDVVSVVTNAAVGCVEKAKVFTFVREKYTVTTAYLVWFGVVKAIFNFITGACCDKFGRKWTLVVGWVLGLPMPILVLAAGSWPVAAASNAFLGMQQALVWSATIFIMVDYLGQKNAGMAIGLNETVGYTTVAIVAKIAAAILDENDPRGACYYVVIAIIVIGILLGSFALKESKDVAIKEEADVTHRTDESVAQAQNAKLTWPSGRDMDVSIPRASFVYTSFINSSLMSICFAGLMINFVSGFAWGLFAKWMKDGYVGHWPSYSADTVANITLCYGLPKGLLQMFFGFIGDRIGRRWLIVSGLGIVALGLAIIAITGVAAGSPIPGFAIGALLMGTGTGVMYTNNLAAIVDHSDPSWRSSALGAYRFWRDLGYAVGALLTGLFADEVGIPGSVWLTAIVTVVSAVCVALFYQEASLEQIVKSVDSAVEDREVETSA